MNDVIGFYTREFYPLDNFSSFKVEYNGYLYSSAEEAFQANLFINDYPEIANEIKNSYSAHEAQKKRLINTNLFYAIIILVNNMSGFGILMIIFSIVLILTGLYMYLGHKIGLFEGRAAFRNLTIDKWKIIGRDIVLISLFVFIIGIIAIIFKFE